MIIINDNYIIQNFVKNNKIIASRCSEIWMSKHNDIKQYLLNRFTDNDKFISYSFIIKRILNKIEELPKCKICGKTLYNLNAKYCSCQCQLKDPEFIEYRVNKSKRHIKEQVAKFHKTCYERYGVFAPAQNKEIFDKVRKTKLEKYGDETFNNTNKIKHTCIEKYGVENPGQIDEVKQKIRNTKQERYNNPTYTNIEKRKHTSIERYGADFYMKTSEFRGKSKQTKLEKYRDEYFVNSEKTKQTCIEKYGVSNYTKTSDYLHNYNLMYYGHKSEFSSKDDAYSYFCSYVNSDNFDTWYNGRKNEIQNKTKQTIYNKYGNTNWHKTDNYLSRKNEINNKLIISLSYTLHGYKHMFDSKNEAYSYFCSYINNTDFNSWYNGYGKEIQEKINNTKRKNKTFNKSIPEDICYIKLKEKYNNVIRQYSSEKYPFACDFYIPPIDLYIECNFMWTHGLHPYNENDNDDIEKLNSWKEKSKTSDFYKNAIYTWTDLDIRKQKIAKENKLNYKVFYNINEFYNWYNNI